MPEPWKSKPRRQSWTLWTSGGTLAVGAAILAAEYHWPGSCGPELVGAAKALLAAAMAFGALRFRTAVPVRGVRG